MNNSKNAQDSNKSFNSFHKRIFLYFIAAERDILKAPESYPDHCESLVNELNALGFHRSKSQWLELMYSWVNSITTKGPDASSSEDLDLEQIMLESQQWSDPNLDQISCVAQYLESNSKASNLWKMMSIELNQMGQMKEDAKFWMDVFHRFAKRLNAKKDLSDYLTSKYKTSPFPSLTKLETRLIRVLPVEKNAQTSTQRTKGMTNVQLENLSTHCRVCLTGASSKMIYLFEDQSNATKCDNVSALTMLNHCCCFSNAATIDDGLPQYICQDCSILLENAYKLKTLCSKTEEKFSDVLYTKKILINKAEKTANESTEQFNIGEVLITLEENFEMNQDDHANKMDDETKCEVCGDVFFSDELFQSHMATAHENYVPKEKFTCVECGKTYRGKHSLNIHLRTHTNERPFVCGMCGKAFKSPSARNRHTVVHSMERNHKCLLCPFVTNTQANLRVHERSHSGVKPYDCRYCSMKFTTSSNVAKHIRNIHEGEKQHKCDNCDRAFFTRESLRMHSVTHTGLKPFICPKKDCLIAFSWYRKLKKHITREHANEKIRIPSEKSYFEQLDIN